MATYLADRVIVFEGQPAIAATATPPQSLLTGMNKFLASLEITFRRDPTNFRPRVNKLNSVKDKEQKGGFDSLLFFIIGVGTCALVDVLRVLTIVLFLSFHFASSVGDGDDEIKQSVLHR